MSAFSEAALEKKLSELSNSQQSVQTLSLWLIHHRKHSRPIVTVKLTFLYLANYVIQNSKRKGPEFTKDFAPVIVEAFKHSAIWEERSVYENDVLEQLKKRTYEQIKVDENENCSSLGSPNLVRALQDLENAASGDAAVHQRIASLPVEVQEITDKEGCLYVAGRLQRQAEIDDRKQLTRMLADFLRSRVSLVRKELRSRIQSLPDLSRLPNVTGSHMHLPFAGDICSED
ncbi:hypothetical protein FD755_013193 [Muntiacus reevesi]|uniref:Regulation of nuclear pre-mRNA domain-containing protein n=1 Tax=Muntiacus reevesi TaxID=9886 RepID=A0A5N3XQ75_MUNRE|nr:hypothetical protein FD755_013193 [Muntiacus reevesi]